MHRVMTLTACTLLLLSARAGARTRKPTATPTPTPTVELSAAPDLARSGQNVSLTASRAINFSSPRWTQIDGPSVPLTGADTPMAVGGIGISPSPATCRSRSVR